MNDRGRIKWSPFLIPEHKKRLAQMYEEEDDVKQPEIDEQMLDTLQATISSAIANRKEITITYYQDKRNKTACGLIRNVDPYRLLPPDYN
ncbi:YolD-like family protein [Thermobacillus composti]|uniref:YolD-like family protein n=1 Tax=Thermobacillus composti TaxID=377615 RepID=UPI00069B9CD1|nr:YolD-like family protein [Thermobacillus composti]